MPSFDERNHDLAWPGADSDQPVRFRCCRYDEGLDVVEPGLITTRRFDDHGIPFDDIQDMAAPLRLHGSFP